MQEEFAGVVARVESLRGRYSPFGPREGERQAPCRASRDIEGLFESLLAQSFDGGRYTMDDEFTVCGLLSTVCFADVVARASCRACRDIESLRGRMGEGLLESLLAEGFG